MLVAIFSSDKDSELPSKRSINYVSCEVNGKKYAIINSLEFGNEWNRIPIEVAKSIMRRDNAQWIYPSSSSEGVAKMNSMINNWVKTVSNVDVNQEFSNFIAPGTNKKNKRSLIDVNNERSRKKRFN